MSHTSAFIGGMIDLCEKLDTDRIEMLRDELRDLKQRGGRLFVLGVGGSAANASHAVNDFRKICCIEAYAPTDNIAELTAWTNDAGWASVFVNWLIESRLAAKDAVLVLSVGGGTRDGVSVNITRALIYAKAVGSPILGVVGRDGGTAKELGTAVVLVPTVDDMRVTPYVESAQGLLLHLLATDPTLAA